MRRGGIGLSSSRQQIAESMQIRRIVLLRVYMVVIDAEKIDRS